MTLITLVTRFATNSLNIGKVKQLAASSDRSGSSSGLYRSRLQLQSQPQPNPNPCLPPQSPVEYDYDYFGFSEYRPGAYANDPYYDELYRSYDGDYNYFEYSGTSGAGGNGSGGGAGGAGGVSGSIMPLPGGASQNAALSGGQRSARGLASGPSVSPGTMVRCNSNRIESNRTLN